MAKYNYMLRGIGYGGELVVGTVSPAFVNYWAPIIDQEGCDELVEVLYDSDWDDEEAEGDALLDPETAPSPTEDFEPGAWHELDDIEHINSTFADSYFELYEVDEKFEEVDGTTQQLNLTDFETIYCRECYFSDERDDNNADVVPVVSMLSSEKGCFWNAVLHLDEPFDPKLLTFGTVESNLCEMIDAIFYDGAQLDMEYDYADTRGKGSYAEVGWLNKKWHDAVIDETQLSDIITDWRSMLED